MTRRLLQEIFEELKAPTPVERLPLPEHHWTFQSERNRPPVEARAPPPIRMAPYTIFHDANDQDWARKQREKKGHCEEHILVGNFLAYLPNYTTITQVADRNEFWLGKVTDLDSNDNVVQVRMYHTGSKQNATKGDNAKYKIWAGSPSSDWIEASRALCQFAKLTNKGRVDAKIRKRIANAIEVDALEKSTAKSSSSSSSSSSSKDDDESDGN